MAIGDHWPTARALSVWPPLRLESATSVTRRRFVSRPVAITYSSKDLRGVKIYSDAPCFGESFLQRNIVFTRPTNCTVALLCSTDFQDETFPGQVFSLSLFPLWLYWLSISRRLFIRVQRDDGDHHVSPDVPFSPLECFRQGAPAVFGWHTSCETGVLPETMAGGHTFYLRYKWELILRLRRLDYFRFLTATGRLAARHPLDDRDWFVRQQFWRLTAIFPSTLLSDRLFLSRIHRPVGSRVTTTAWSHCHQLVSTSADYVGFLLPS